MPNKPSPFRLLSVLAFLIAPWAYGQTASNTVLSLSARSVPHGTAVTLSARVEANGSPVAPGLVTFVDGKTVLGSAQLLSGGTASLKVMAGLGTHAITARFAGTKSFSKSNSAPQSLTVTGTVPTATTINVAGNAGSYTLSGTVTSSGALPLTGSVSFADQTNHLSPGSAALGAVTTTQVFGAQTVYDANDPTTVAVSDLNGDGIPDLVSANQSHTLSVLLGAGDGTFKITTSDYSGGSPQAAVVSDFNSDGRPDLVITNQGDSTVNILLGQGDGTFGGQAVYPLSSGAAPLAVAIGDFNGDGVPDLATASHAGLLSVLLGNLTQTATATLNPVALIGTGTHPVAASYGGDSFHEASTSSTTPLIAFSPAFTSLALTAAPAAITAGQPLTLQATLGTATQSFNTNGESVTFYNGWKVLGTAPLHNGQAALTTSVLTGGSNLLFATFAGDGNLTGATSNTVAVTVNAGNAGSNFTLTPLQPTETVPPSGLAGLVLALQSVNGFGGPVTLSCFGGPAGSSCLEFPLTVPLSGTTYIAAGVLFPPGTKPGTYTITFQAVTFKSASGSVTHATTVRFTVP